MKYKLICFDLDGTLIDGVEYAWETLHKALGVPEEENRKNLMAYRNREITYAEWAQRDLVLLRRQKATKEKITAIVKKLRLMKGTRETLRHLQNNGCKLAVISGSFKTVMDVIFPDHPFTDVFINEIIFDADGTVKDIKQTPFDMEHKATGLKMIAEREGIDLSECAYIGDNSNDIHVAEIAGLAIAFNSKSEELNKVCDVVIKKKDLREVLKHIEA